MIGSWDCDSFREELTVRYNVTSIDGLTFIPQVIFFGLKGFRLTHSSLACLLGLCEASVACLLQALAHMLFIDLPHNNHLIAAIITCRRCNMGTTEGEMFLSEEKHKTEKLVEQPQEAQEVQNSHCDFIFRLTAL